MSDRIRTALGAMAIFAIVFVAVVMLLEKPSAGTEPADCENPTIHIVDAAAYDEVVPGTPTLWGNWSPNHNQGPFDGPPAYPTDSRGTWQMHEGDGGPSQGTYGVFQQGNGNGDWFVRIAGTADTIIHHDEVSHDEPNPNYPCTTTTVPDDDPPPTTEVPPPTTEVPPPPTTEVPPVLPNPPCVVKVGTQVLDCDETFIPTGSFDSPNQPPPTELARTGISNLWLAAIGAALIAAGYVLTRLSRSNA